LEDLLGAPVESFAYPMGGWSAPVVNAVRAAAYANAVTVDRGTQPRSRDPLLVRRSFAPRGAADFRRTLRGGYSFLRPVDRWRTRNGPVF
jgi:hypothetical protein